MFIVANCLLVPLLKVNDLVDIVSQVDSPTNMNLDVQVPLFINIGLVSENHFFYSTRSSKDEFSTRSSNHFRSTDLFRS